MNRLLIFVRLLKRREMMKKSFLEIVETDRSSN